MVQKKYGTIDEITRETEYNIRFQYEGMRVGGFESEESYLHSTADEFESKEKGSSDEWLKGWEKAKLDIYEPEFTNALNKVLDKRNRLVAEKMHARFTLIVRTQYVEPGRVFFDNIQPELTSTLCNFEFDFVDATNPEKLILRLYVQDVYQKGLRGFDLTDRIAGCYARAGKLLGKYLVQYY